MDDLNLGWSSPAGHYSASFYIHNLTNEAYKQNAAIVSPGFNPPYSAGLTTTLPRTYGVILRASY